MNKNNQDSCFSDSESYETSSLDIENSLKKIGNRKYGKF
jgi:hypothetical protein